MSKEMVETQFSGETLPDSSGSEISSASGVGGSEPTGEWISDGNCPHHILHKLEKVIVNSYLESSFLVHRGPLQLQKRFLL